ncbi:Smr domain protein [Cedecea davisae DSM 4568]|uniref:Smr domain protein n=1 Tax=Cedecea davisae DSM 4568 TaxID=566551 RepID=S3IY49_9ENTR|nr:Smr domain protein [Cedecea davisae DSM 4568]
MALRPADPLSRGKCEVIVAADNAGGLTVNLDDKSLFLDAMEDVKPLKNCADSQWIKPQKEHIVAKPDLLQLDNFLTTDFLEIVPLGTQLEYKREGLQNGVLDKLRQGKYSQQASLNLLRQPVERCRQLLFAYIMQAKQDGLRNLLIVHGKGREDKSHPNVVRSFLARWLVEFDEVQAFCVAMPHHGGSGACYVALKKSEQAKLETWEKHAKRSR